MTAGERFKSWIDAAASSWADRLKAWLCSILAWGLEVLLDVLGKAFAPKLKPAIEELEKAEDIPDWILPILKEIKEPTGEVGAILAQSAGGAIVGGAIGSVIDALFLRFSYSVNKMFHPRLPNEAQMISMWLRGLMSPERLKEGLQSLGADDLTITTFKELANIRLDPMSWITALRRDYKGWDKIKDDLAHQGWDEDRIEALKFVTLFYPSPRDLVGFLAHEVYEDDMAARYGLDADFREVAEHLDKFEKAGMKEPQVREFWRDHWEHTSYLQMVEMLHRGLLTETGQPPPTTIEGWKARDAEGTGILRDWYKLVEIADFWRDKLTAMSWNVPTRVDVRRWWDMRTISEEELRNIYHRQGYHGTDLDNYVLWTKVYVAFPDILARMKNGWISPEEAKELLAKTGLEEPRLTELWETRVKTEQPARTTAEKDLTKTEIYKGVKKDLLSWEQGIELLMDLGYSEDEADYILAVNVGVLEGSPETFADFKDWTTKYKIAAGREAKPMPEELKRAAEEVVRLTGELEALERSIAEEKEGLLEVEPLPAEATEKLTELQVTRNRAIAELERVKQEYDQALAEWRHKAE